MDLAGELVIPASRERVWQALNDSAVLRACIPGCEELVDESPTVRRARVLVKVGPVRARFDGRMTLGEVEAPQRCVLGFEGSGGAAGIASGRSQVELHDEGAATRITYAVKAAVGGKLGQIGGRMIDASARQLADQFFDALRRQLTPAQEPAPILPATQNQVASVPAALALPPEPAEPVAAASAEVPRLLWFLLGVASTGFGVWLGKSLL